MLHVCEADVGEANSFVYACLVCQTNDRYMIYIGIYHNIDNQMGENA